MNTKKIRLSIFILIITALTLTVYSTEQFLNEPVSYIEGIDAYPFERVELLVDNSPNFKFEPYHEKNKLSHTALLKLTRGNNELHSANFFLHYSQGWNKNSGKNPILLVHGAGDTAFRAWAHPFKEEVEPNEQIEYYGLALELPQHGFQVFSITFAHSHGDNFMQSEHIANAISRIRKVLGRENDENFKVDIIGHSKGGVSSRMYISDIREEYDEYKWLTPFRKDVDKFMSLASPLNGVDAQYRYYGMNLLIVQDDYASPVGFDKLLYYGSYIDYSNNWKFFPGQDQLLNNLVDDPNSKIPFSNLSMTASDMNYTRNVLYYGGVSTFLTSSGIKKAMERGKNLISKLNKKGADPSVRIIVLAGNDNQIDDNIEFWFDLLPIGEKISPSDMLVFVKSATYTDGITRRGAKLLDKQVIPYNHMNITFHREAKKIIVDLMAK